MTTELLPEPRMKVKYWMIYFEDQSVRPEFFTDPQIAQLRYEACLIGYNCHLFEQISDRRASPPAPKSTATDVEIATRLVDDAGLEDTTRAGLIISISDALAKARTLPAPAAITKLIADQQDCPPEFSEVFARRHTEMLATDASEPGDDNCPVCGFPPPPEPTADHRERARLFMYDVPNAYAEHVTKLASQFAEIREETIRQIAEGKIKLPPA